MEKTAIVTGASSGIGLAISKMLVQKGFLVYGGFKKTGHWNDLEWLRIHFSMFRGSVHVVGEGKEVY